jgi:RHS repeat-associated protein
MAVTKTSGTGPIVYDSTTWWVANLAKRISQGGTAVYSDFWYGPGRERIQLTAKKSASVTETTLYVGGLYEKVTRGSTVEHVHYIPGGGHTVAIQKKTVGGSTETRYLHRDHLGSVVAATDYTGAVLERYSFDPWGKRRDPATWVTPAPGTFSYDPAFNDRGYTGHEHIDHLGLVNMNGRVYDPEIGRFLSADPFVQFPESTQGYNRYTYVGNNPLSYTDPSGFFSFREFFQILGIVMSFIIPTGINLLWEKLIWGFMAGFMASGGDLKAGALGMLGAGLFHGIGGLKGLDDIARAFVHGAASGVLAELGDGTFKSGFFGGFIGALGGMAGAKMFGPAGSGGTIGAIKRTIVAALAGGVGSAAGGGKFKNGAVTAAMANMFNGEMHAKAGAESQAEAEDGRPLTDNEKAAAKSEYGSEIKDYDSIRVFGKKWAFFQGRNTAMAPDGNIYWPAAKACADLTTCSITIDNIQYSTERTFIHEMGHVMQYQNGINVAARALPLQIGRVFGKDPYLSRSQYYQIQSPANLNVEAQADCYSHDYCVRTGRC